MICNRNKSRRIHVSRKTCFLLLSRQILWCNCFPWYAPVESGLSDRPDSLGLCWRIPLMVRGISTSCSRSTIHCPTYSSDYKYHSYTSLRLAAVNRLSSTTVGSRKFRNQETKPVPIRGETVKARRNLPHKRYQLSRAMAMDKHWSSMFLVQL